MHTTPALEPVLAHLAALQQDITRPLLLAIDGRAGAGKTTLANRLAEVLHCPVIHMDDFYLRQEQRTPERLAAPGGNLDYERFNEEVLTPLTHGAPVQVRPYSCRTDTFGTAQDLPLAKVLIIEGSYSQHPFFYDPYDLTVFLDMDDATQLAQLRTRESPDTLARFQAIWIPMEDRYFQAFGIRDQADFLAYNRIWQRVPPPR